MCAGVQLALSLPDYLGSQAKAAIDAAAHIHAFKGKQVRCGRSSKRHALGALVAAWGAIASYTVMKVTPDCALHGAGVRTSCPAC